MHSDHLILSAQHVSFSYGALSAVEDVDLALSSSDAIAMVGPNGSGKTTLLKLLSGNLKPDAGRVCLGDRELSTIRPKERARHIAVVSQSADPRLLFTVEQLVAMGRTPYASLLGVPDREDRRAIAEAFLATETTDLRFRRFGELSGGEQQRVMLAVALAQEPRYLLLDEPTVHLDLHHQHELLELLMRLRAERSMSILSVMHDLNLASLYFERIAVMNQGRLLAAGPSDQLVARADILSVFKAPLSIVSHPQTGSPQVLLERRD